MISNHIKRNRLLTLAVFTIGILALAWASQPPTLPLYRAISRAIPGGHFAPCRTLLSDPPLDSRRQRDSRALIELHGSLGRGTHSYATNANYRTLLLSA